MKKLIIIISVFISCNLKGQNAGVAFFNRHFYYLDSTGKRTQIQAFLLGEKDSVFSEYPVGNYVSVRLLEARMESSPGYEFKQRDFENNFGRYYRDILINSKKYCLQDTLGKIIVHGKSCKLQK